MLKYVIELRVIYNQQDQGRIYYEANEASTSGPHHLGGPHQNFNAVSKADFLFRKNSLKVNLL